MPIPPRLFIDACVLVAAANSPSGGSARLLQIAGEGKIRLAATRLVMHEAKTNIVDLLGRPVWPWFCQIIGPKERKAGNHSKVRLYGKKFNHEVDSWWMK